jgi:hypothetical protein
MERFLQRGPAMRSGTNELPVESVLHAWLADPDLTLFCGDWRQGSVMELLPRGDAQLSGPRYDPPFDGMRELRLNSGAHHVHLDLGRLTRAWYVIAPSVCYGFRPSFEVRLTSADGDPRTSCALGLALNHPYSSGVIRTVPVRRYLRRAIAHLATFPDVVAFRCERGLAPDGGRVDWSGIDQLLSGITIDSAHGTDTHSVALRHVSNAMAASA